MSLTRICSCLWSSIYSYLDILFNGIILRILWVIKIMLQYLLYYHINAIMIICNYTGTRKNRDLTPIQIIMPKEWPVSKILTAIIRKLIWRGLFRINAMARILMAICWLSLVAVRVGSMLVKLTKLCRVSQ